MYLSNRRTNVFCGFAQTRNWKYKNCQRLGFGLEKKSRRIKTARAIKCFRPFAKFLMRIIDLQKAKTQIARSSTIRDINRQIVLNYVREREPISRAEIARETALQRSTVSSIIGSLVEDGFIAETGAGASSGGRKPTMLRLRTDEIVAVGVDITPTTTTIATANLAGKILNKEILQTSSDRTETFDEIVSRLLKITEKLKNQTVEIGVSVPGLVDEVSGVVSYVPYFYWKNWELKRELEKAVGLPVVVDNDANSIAIAELWFGRPEVRGIKHFISVLIAEGIGTGIIIDGQIYRGQKGAAGEFGHMFVGEDSGGVDCSCGNTHCWEAFASNTATLGRFAKLTEKNEIDIDEIFALARKGDEAAVQVIDETTRYLAVGIVNLIVGLSPEAVIISGKITSIWSVIEQKLLERIAENIKQKLPETKVRASTLGESPTLMGAISLSLIKKFASAR